MLLGIMCRVHVAALHMECTMAEIMKEIYVILYNLRSAHNVGSLFRTADGAGVAKIYLVGYTPTPHDRFGRIRQDILKTSLGATKEVPFEVVSDIYALLTRLEQENIAVVAVEQTDRAIHYKDFSTPKSVAYIFGNETDGIPLDVLDRVATHIQIPMLGKKESLNVSVCGGVILFESRK